jgi:tetratricopeptide (TPR) repeat protein
MAGAGRRPLIDAGKRLLRHGKHVRVVDVLDGVDAMDVVTGVVTPDSGGPMLYSYGMSFEDALEDGRLEEARSLLDDLATTPDTGGLWLPECYADLAQAFDRRGQHDHAIASLERAIKHGWSGRPDPRSDIAEFHLRAGRRDEAASIWAELRAMDPEDVWLYNAAGLSYNEVGDHELAIEWLGEGIELAIRTEDPEGIVPQLSGVRRGSLAALGRDLDDLERRADEFIAQGRERSSGPRSWTELSRAADDWLAAPEVDDAERSGAGEVAVAMAWFPAGEYENAIARWDSVAEDWAGVPHPDYCQRMDGHIKWMRANGVYVRALAPIAVDDFVAWCEERAEDPEHARAHYAAERYRRGEAIGWPPGRNHACWCGSGRKYKKCCGSAVAAPMHAGPA